jgi:hypothetical protein
MTAEQFRRSGQQVPSRHLCNAGQPSFYVLLNLPPTFGRPVLDENPGCGPVKYISSRRVSRTNKPCDRLNTHL